MSDIRYKCGIALNAARESESEQVADVANLKADIKDLEVRLTRLIYAVGVGILISVIGSIVSIGMTMARLF